MSDFEKWFVDQDFYTNMRFIHGDKLFDKDGDVYRVLSVHIAFESWFASACTSIDYIHRLQHEKTDQKAKIDELQKRVDELQKVLTQISEWDSHPDDFEIDFGAWGVRDFYRRIATEAMRGEHV